jgi:hypothetical protein
MAAPLVRGIWSGGGRAAARVEEYRRAPAPLQEAPEEIGGPDRQDYDASARETIRTGKRFNLRDRWTGDWRAGFYDVVMGRLTVLTEDEELIVTHYPCSERHVRDQLWRSDYD